MIKPGELDLTPEQLDEMRWRWRKAVEQGRGHPVLLTPLTRRQRARMAFNSVLDGIGVWLMVHVHWRAGWAVWKVFGRV